MENNRVTEIRTSALQQRSSSGWEENIDFQMALRVSSQTLESPEQSMRNRNRASNLMRFPRGVAVLDDRGAWVIEQISDEPQWREIDIDSNSDSWSKKLGITQGMFGRILGWSDALELATTTDLALDDTTQRHRPLQDLQAEEMLGIFTISRSPNVIFKKSIQLTSRLDKRKPNISPYVLLQDEKE